MIPSASSASRRNSASTTKVVPCSCGAGPKTQPQTVRNHEVMADGDAVDAVHGWPSAAQSYRAFDRRRPRRGRTCGIKSGKVENALSPPGERGIVRLSSDLAPAGATTPNTSTSRIEITIEQRVTTEVETADPRPQCAVERTVAGKCDTGTPRSDDDRGDRYLQTVEAACLEKVRDRDPAALDEYDRQSPVTQRGADRRNIECAADARHAKDFAPMCLAPAHTRRPHLLLEQLAQQPLGRLLITSALH